MGTLTALDITPRLYHFSDNHFLSLAPQFEEFSGKNVLESLKFSIWPEFLTLDETDPAEWEILDNILSKSGGFPFLRRVEIVVNLCDDPVDQELERDLLDIGKNHFPFLRACDGLNFRFAVRTHLFGSWSDKEAQP